MAVIGCSNSNNNNSNYEKEISQNPEDTKTVIPIIIEIPAIIEEESEPVVEDECLENIYTEEFLNSIVVEAKYKECEKDRNYGLVIKKGGNVIFKADSLLGYVFNNHEFPTYIHNANFEYILVERNDKLLLNNTDVFRIRENRVDSVYSIPNFKNQGMDLDNDGHIEYWAKLDYNNKNADGKTIYNPFLAYEIGENVFRFDSLITIELNKRTYGDFYGVERIDTLIFDNI